MAKRKRYDTKQPGTQKLVDEIVHGTFMTEGTMVAFPLCFPAVSMPIPADESRITAMDVSASGMVYAGTSGRAAHLVVGMFHGVTGMVLDLGKVEGATESVAFCCGQGKFVAAVNGPQGGQLIARRLQSLPFDLIQEWHIGRMPFETVQGLPRGERLVHAVTDAKRERAIGVTEKRLFSVEIESSRLELGPELPGRGRLARGEKGGVFGPDDDGMLWRYDAARRALKRNAVRLPRGEWGHALRWARDPASGTLYTADAAGRLFGFSEKGGFTECLGRAPVTPVGPMAVTGDGRLFGACGEGIGKLFCYNPATRSVTRLGVAVSVFERRRYGYAFGDAVTGRDGEIVFGEDDDLGHLWLYFPRIQPLAALSARRKAARRKGAK
jgi:hypothetical protein